MGINETKNMQQIEYKIANILELISQPEYKSIITKDVENVLQDLFHSILQNNMLNAINLIDRVIETGDKNINGFYKQFNVSALEIIDNKQLFLRTFEVIGYDKIDKKYVLDNVVAFIDFTRVTKIY